MEERTIEVEEVTLAVAEAGEGGHPLLVLHGFTGAKEDFCPWLDAFADLGFHAVAPDHRGHGDSAKPSDEGAYSLDIFATDALALADRMGFTEFALLGHSMGGMVAQHVALSAPHRVSALVLMNTGHGTVAVDRDLAAWGVSIAREEGIDALADILASIESPLDTPAHQRLLAENPDHKAFDERKLRASSPAMYAAMAAALTAEHDRLEALAALDMPTLVIVGDQDDPFLVPSERMADTIATAELVVVPDAGHSPQFEQPSVWERQVFRFLEDQLRSSRRASA